MSEGPDTTKLLISASAGDREAFDLLYERLYDELRQIAHHRLMHSARGETLNTAALVHEAYLKLVDQSRIAFSDRAHFLALASRAMRFILIDHARARSAQKRRGNADVRPLDGLQIVADDRAADLLARNGKLDEAEPLLQEALAIRERSLAPDHPSTIRSRILLIEVLTARRKFDEAEVHARKVLEALATAPGAPASLRRMARDALVALYTAWGRPNDAPGVRARLDPES